MPSEILVEIYIYIYSWLWNQPCFFCLNFHLLLIRSFIRIKSFFFVSWSLLQKLTLRRRADCWWQNTKCIMSSNVSLPLYNLHTGVNVIGHQVDRRSVKRSWMDFIRDNGIQHVQLGGCKLSSNSVLLIGVLCKKALSFNWYFVCAKTVTDDM